MQFKTVLLLGLAALQAVDSLPVAVGRALEDNDIDRVITTENIDLVSPLLFFPIT